MQSLPPPILKYTDGHLLGHDLQILRRIQQKIIVINIMIHSIPIIHSLRSLFSENCIVCDAVK